MLNVPDNSFKKKLICASNMVLESMAEWDDENELGRGVTSLTNPWRALRIRLKLLILGY